jgi:hypothetical protein
MPSTSKNVVSERIWIGGIFLILVSSFYLLGFPTDYQYIVNYHQVLGDSFIHGQTYLPIQVSPLLLAKPNPYDPAGHTGLGLWDASLFNGRYYLYFGPVPALLVYIPVKLLTGISLSTSSMALFFLTLGTISLIILLNGMLSFLPQTQHRIVLVITSAVIGYGTWLPHILRPSTYEVSIAAAYCFTSLGFLLLWLCTRNAPSPRFLLMALAGLCMGLAVGSRHLHILNGLILLYAWLALSKKYNQHRIEIGMALFMPWLLCIECLMAYNFVRFGDFLETGIHYQLTVENLNSPDFSMLRADKFFNNVYLFLLRPIEWKFPLTFPPFKIPILFSANIFGILPVETSEPIYGLFACSPFVLFLFTPPQKKHAATMNAPQTQWLYHSITCYGLLIASYMLFFFFTTQRYAVDFSPWLMFAASIRFATLLGNTQDKTRYTTYLTLGILTAAYSAFNGIMLNLSR